MKELDRLEAVVFVVRTLIGTFLNRGFISTPLAETLFDMIKPRSASKRGRKKKSESESY